MEARGAWLPIARADLEEFTRPANALLARVEWQPKPGLAAAPRPTSPPGYRESMLEPASTETVSLLKLGRTISGDEALLTNHVNHALQTVREGLKLGMHLSKLYTEASGLERLVEHNRRGGLAEAQKVEFRGKYATASAVAVFVCAYFVVDDLADYKPDELGTRAIEFAGVPELSLQNPVRALQCLLFYYGRYLESGSVRTDLDLVRLTQLYFRAVLDEVKLREASLEYPDPFTQQAYKLEDGDFHVQGFELDLRGSEASVEFNRVDFSQIVGNRGAKHSARRLVERLLCYDPATGRNPFVELGGFPTVRLGYGKPGTGKSLQIAATATLLHDRCRALGLPFLFWPMPDTVVSTFQGGSAERMVAWMRPLQDPSRIVYAPIDDAENNLEDRTRQGVSAGVREVIGVFLRYTEGAYAVNHGNAAIDIFTNLPDQLDRAVLSRVVARFAVDGAKTFEDFLDQDYLWWRGYTDIDPGFIGMRDPATYSYLAAQARLRSLSEAETEDAEPDEAAIRRIFERITTEHTPNEHAFFATLYARVHAEFPFFTSRDVRNIQQAINSRIMDFDLPETWFDTPELFFRRDYDAKKALLVELMHANMRGLNFAEIRLQETVKYLDTMIRIQNVTRDQRIGALVDEALLREEAETRLEAKRRE